MAQLIRYIARKPFKYDGKWLKAGDEWEPVGGRFDAQIIRNKQVVIDYLDEPEADDDESDAPKAARPRTRQVKRRGATK